MVCNTLEMNNFYPGPSKLYPQVRLWLSETYDSGILAQNHRSDAFMELWESTKQQLRHSLNIPEDYEIYVASSATECWEIVIQSLIFGNTYFVYNGAFGKKWANYAAKNSSIFHRENLEIVEQEFDFNTQPPTIFTGKPSTICFTHNETSNGTCLPADYLKLMRHENPDALLAFDATSSMAGVSLPWKCGDVWFASVQKCFGLPSGLALLVVSPQAIERAELLNDGGYYNSLLNIRANFLKNQTPYTPNILGIALLNKQAGFVENIGFIHEKTRSRAADFYEFIEQETAFDLLVKDELVRSQTVIAVSGKSSDIQQVMSICKNKGITLGKGYGEWKETTFRIANFPAIENGEFAYLKEVLKN